MYAISTPHPFRFSSSMSAANIPPELFQEILRFPVLAVFEPFHRNYVKVNKRELGAYSLVCKHWAKMCQPHLFEDVTLRSREDLEQLLSFLDSSVSAVSRYIWRIQLGQKGLSVPWIHLLSLWVFPKLRRSVVPVVLHLESPMGALSSASFRSIHFALPRTHPSFSSKINHMKLSHITFRSFLDLLHVVKEMPVLRKLEGFHLSWPTPPDIVPSLPSAAYLRDISLSDCANSWAALWLVLVRRKQIVQIPGFSPIQFDLAQERSVVCSLVRSITNKSDCWVRTHRFGQDGYMIAYNNLSCQSGLGSFLNLIIAPGPLKPSEKEATSHVFAISLCFIDCKLTLDEALLLDWKNFDDNASRLLHLQKVIFGFGSREDMLHFAENVVDPAMVQLKNAGKLRFAVRPEGRRRWFTADPDTEKMEETWNFRLEEF